MSSYTIEELFMEFMEDRIDEDPMEAYPPIEEGEAIAFRRTGDSKIDAWEQKLASGQELTAKDFADDPAVLTWLKGKRPVDKKQPAAAKAVDERPAPDLDRLMDEMESGFTDHYGDDRADQ